MTGRQILLVRSLGEGTTGTRFRAMERYGSHRRSVFVHLARTQAERAALEDLSRSWSGDGGPLLAAMRPSWRQSGQQALVMDHPGGASLRNLLATHRRLPPAVALRIAADVARGLANFWRDTPADSSSEQAIDFDGAYLRGDGRLALVCRICEREQLSELVGRLLGGRREHPLEIFDEFAQDGALDLMDTLSSLPEDGEEAGRALGTLARTYAEPELGIWAKAHVDAAQRRLPPAAVDPAYGRILGEEAVPLDVQAMAVPEAAPPSPAPPTPKTASSPRPTTSSPTPPHRKPEGGMPDIRPSADAPAEQARRQRAAAGVGMAVFFTIVGVAAIVSGRACGTEAETPAEAAQVEAAEAVPAAQVDDGVAQPDAPATSAPDAPDADAPDAEEARGDSDAPEAHEPVTASSDGPPDSHSESVEGSRAPEPAPRTQTTQEVASKPRPAKTTQPKPKAPTRPAPAAKPKRADPQAEDDTDDRGARILGANSPRVSMGTVRLPLGSEPEVWLVNESGRHSGGRLAVGTYTIMARFDTDSTVAGSLELRSGNDLTVRCSTSAMLCKADDTE